MTSFPLQLPIEATKPRAIEITDYHFKDQVARGDKAQKKIIAQQVGAHHADFRGRGDGGEQDHGEERD